MNTQSVVAFIRNLGRRWPLRLASLAAIFLSLSSAGCRTKALTDPIIGPNHQVSNVFRKEPMLPPTLRRVAVLPMSYPEDIPSLVAGKDALEPLFRSELGKTARFETLPVDSADLKRWTGREHWDAYEALPPDLFKLLAEKTGCNAVLFPTLTKYSAYPPIVIGWRMKLVANDADIIWAVEEIFDASEQGVSNAARRYDRDHVRSNPVLEDSRSVLISPSRFGKYTLHAILETLPNR